MCSEYLNYSAGKFVFAHFHLREYWPPIPKCSKSTSSANCLRLSRRAALLFLLREIAIVPVFASVGLGALDWFFGFGDLEAFGNPVGFRAKEALGCAFGLGSLGVLGLLVAFGSLADLLLLSGLVFLSTSLPCAGNLAKFSTFRTS